MSRRPTAIAAAVLAAAVLAAVAVAAVKPPTGDQEAIRFFGSQFNAYQQVLGVKIVEDGYFSMKSLGGADVSYRWSVPVTRGYTPATAEVLAWLDGARISAYVATLRAPKIRRVRILMAGGQVFVSSATCWHKSNAGSSPFGTGDVYLLNDGGARFQPLRRTAGGTVATLSYDWAPGARAVEMNTFTSGSPPAIDTRITVTGSQKLSVHKRITPLAEAPALPIKPPPAQPAPKPLCK